MVERLRKFIDAMDVARDVRMLRSAMRSFTEAFGFRWYVFMKSGATAMDILSNTPTKWNRAYHSRNYSRIDPIVAHAKRGMKPFVWTMDKQMNAARSAEERQFRADAIRFDIRCGLTMPVEVSFGRTAMITLASPANVESPSILLEADTAALLVTFVYMRLEASTRDSLIRNSVNLTSQELVCLRWAARGVKMPAIGSLVGIEHRTVQYHFDNARKKLQAANLTHAVNNAKDMGLLD